MRTWLIRGLVMAVLHAAAFTTVAKVEVYQPTGATVIQAVAIAVLVGAAALWSALDGWLRREDSGRTWFIAALVAGPVSGVLYVIARAIFVDQTSMNELWPALTGGAAFTALLVLIPAGLGLLVGGRLESPRKAARTDDEAEEDAEEDTEPAQRPSKKPIG
jgi:hypothetical protein